MKQKRTKIAFSGLLVSLLGHSQAISIPLLFFNVGLELGQLLFVVFILWLQSLLQRVKPEFTNTYIKSAAIIGLSLGIYLFVGRF